MKQDLNEQIKAIVERATEIFKDIPDQSDDGLRDFLQGEPQIDAGISYSEIRGDANSLIIHNMDYEILRYKHRKLFAENIVINSQQIELLKQTYELTNLEARAVYFVNLLLLCEHYEEMAVSYHAQLIEDFLDDFINSVQPKLIEKCLNKFRGVSTKSQNKNALKIDVPVNLDFLLNQAHVFVRPPKGGRPLNSIALKTVTESEISQAIFDLLEEKIASVTSTDEIEEAVEISRKELAKKLGVSSPTFIKRLNSLKLDFDEIYKYSLRKFLEEKKFVNELIKEYLQTVDRTV